MIAPPVTIRPSLCGGGYFLTDSRGLIVAGVTKNLHFQHGWASGDEAQENVQAIAALLNGDIVDIAKEQQ